MDTIMIPILQAPKAVAAIQVQTVTGKKIATNFSDYMEGKLSTESQSKGALFGMGQGTAAVVPGAGTEKPLAATNVAALLAQFVQDLKAASEEKKLGAGEWAFPAPSPQLMQKMAKDAGMNESQLVGLFAKVKNQEGKLPLADLLASFSRHFQGLQSAAPITAPETDLPLVQIILERLGVPVAEVEKISQATVRGDNSFDLKKLAELVQGISGERITDLSPLEAEQLQDLLAAAGVSGQLQRALLPERLPVIEGLVESGPPVTITLGRLKDILGQAVQEIKANQLQADPIAFLTDLHEVLGRSGFETAGPQLSSAVQGTVVAIFEKLMESVDPGEGHSARDYSAANSIKEGKDQGYWQENFVADGEQSAAALESNRSLLRRLLERSGVPGFEVDRISEAAAGADNAFVSREVFDLLQGLTEGIIARLTTKAGEVGETAEFAGNAVDLQKLTGLMPRLTGEKIAGLDPELVEITEAPAQEVNPADLYKMAGLLQSAAEEKITDLTSEVRRISNAALRGDSIVDLQKVAGLLQSLTGITITDLDAAEVEQGSVVEGFVESVPALTHILDRLQKMLAQGVREVKANRLQTDPLSFLADLHEVLSRIGFETNSPRRSAAVQANLVAVFKELMESVDLARVKVQQGAIKPGLALEKKLDETQDLFAVQDADAGALPDGEVAEPVLGMGRDGQAGKEGKGAQVSGELFAENSVLQSVSATAAKAEAVAAVASQAARPFVHIPNLPPGLQQQSFAQLSQGVLQGLRNQEHHLVLTLYPKELGEVKVEMTVRDNQVAVSFIMENSRVKAVLESNLEQFRENMEKQGFALGDCMVSLNRDNNDNEAWQQFQAASQENRANRRRTTLADLPEDILYQRVQPGNGRANGVDLFA